MGSSFLEFLYFKISQIFENFKFDPTVFDKLVPTGFPIFAKTDRFSIDISIHCHLMQKPLDIT
jgi:hypothetical protein